MSRLELADRIALGLLCIAVILGCCSPFALAAIKDGEAPQARTVEKGNFMPVAAKGALRADQYMNALDL